MHSLIIGGNIDLFKFLKVHWKALFKLHITEPGISLLRPWYTAILAHMWNKVCSRMLFIALFIIGKKLKALLSIQEGQVK